MTDQAVAVTVEAGLQAEQDLLAAVCKGEKQHGLLFWQPTDRALVMPRRMSRLEGFEAACTELAVAGWPVLLRETGGEPVPQSAATINIALVYVAPRSEGDHGRIEKAYECLCQPAARPAGRDRRGCVRSDGWLHWLVVRAGDGHPVHQNRHVRPRAGGGC